MSLSSVTTIPPVCAWAALKIYETEKKCNPKAANNFLNEIYKRLKINFDWWINNIKFKDEYSFGGGFLGMDNISIIDRNQFSSDQVKIKQVDSAGWMALYCLNLIKIIIELNEEELSNDQKFPYMKDLEEILNHFLNISDNLNKLSPNSESVGHVDFWDIEDYFYYDILHIRSGTPNNDLFAMDVPLKYRSILGIIPLFAVEILPFNTSHYNQAIKYIHDYIKTNQQRHQHLFGEEESFYVDEREGREKIFFSVANKKKLVTILDRLFNEEEFLSKYGIRSLSKFHEGHPYEMDGLVENRYKQKFPIRIKYEPAETNSHVFTGNSNWRGPIWFPINYLVIESLAKFYKIWNDIKRPFPTLPPDNNTRDKIPLYFYKNSSIEKNNDSKTVVQELACRLIDIFMPKNSHRPVNGYNDKIQDVFSSEHWKDYILFYEYFNGDNGSGLGASHQTGWTGLIANIIDEFGEYYEATKINH